MKTKGLLATRLAAAAFLAIASAVALAQDFGGQDGPPQGGMRGGRGGMRGGPQALDRLPALVSLATRKEVVAELGLTEDQVDQIRAIAESSRPPRGDQGTGERPDPSTREKLEAAVDAKVASVLSAAQAKRLTEIQIQSMGLTAALVPTVQTKLGLSADQKTQLKALVPARRGPGQGGPEGGPGGGPDGPPPGGEAFQGGPGQGGPGQDGPGQGGPRPGGPGGEAQRKALEKKIAAILTDDQKAALKALGGRTIQLAQDRGPDGPGQGRPGQGGPGGPPPDGGR